jgi:hypothetical protein
MSALIAATFLIAFGIFSIWVENTSKHFLAGFQTLMEPQCSLRARRNSAFRWNYKTNQTSIFVCRQQQE